MNSKFASLILTAGLIAVSGAGGAWIASSFLQRPERTHQDFHDRLFSELRLTPEQRARMEALEERHAAENKTLNEALANANRELADTLGRETAYTDDVERAIENVHTAMLALQKDAVRHLYEMREILDASQREAFDRHVAETLQEYASRRID